MYLSDVIEPQSGLAVVGAHEGVGGEPPEQRGFAHAILAHQDHLQISRSLNAYNYIFAVRLLHPLAYHTFAFHIS